MSILKDYQGKGLGQVLVKALTAVAEAVGCCRVMLDCSKDKEGFYGKCGFVDDGGLHMVHKFEERQ